MIQPTRRGIHLAAAGFAFALLPTLLDPHLWTFWPIYVAWLVAIYGSDLLLAPRRSGLRCDLDRPDLLYVGAPDRAVVSVSVPARRALPVELVVDCSDHLSPPPPMRVVLARGRGRVELKLSARRRGTACVEAVWIRYHGPFGLMRLSRRIPLNAEIPVTPDVLPVRAVALRFFGDPASRVGLKIERFEGEGTEFDSLRELMQGDDTRTIDWKASARHRKLLGRQFRAERNHQVVFAIDNGHLMGETVGGMAKLDHALHAMLVLAYVCLRAGDRVGLCAFGARVGTFIEPRAGVASHAVLTRAASGIDYSEAETNFTLGLTTLSQRLRRRSLIIVLTDFVDTVTAELMLENLDRLARRHLVLFVALRDPGPERLASGTPVDALALNRSVVAHSLVRDREIVIRRLQRGGILAIDAPPEEVGHRMINDYLDIKRRERI